MPYKDPADRRAYQRTWVENHRESTREAAKLARNRTREHISACLKRVICPKCAKAGPAGTDTDALRIARHNRYGRVRVAALIKAMPLRCLGCSTTFTIDN